MGIFLLSCCMPTAKPIIVPSFIYTKYNGVISLIITPNTTGNNCSTDNCKFISHQPKLILSKKKEKKKSVLIHF